MDLKALLNRDYVVLGMRAPNRRAVFAALVAPLVSAGVVTDAELLIADLERREDQFTTQIEGGIALPHARSHAAKRLALTVGTAEAPGLVFDPSSPQLVRLFFLIAVPAFAPTAHLPLLQRIADFCRDRQHVARLLSCTSQAQIVAWLARFKGN
jgi:mannitol/fructose-specific phosphotransferase system IIA component (Ntr-type)